MNQASLRVPPPVIDFSPLERPAGLPLAIAAVDGLHWQHARAEVPGQLADEPEPGQPLDRHIIENIRRAGMVGIDTAARTGKPVAG